MALKYFTDLSLEQDQLLEASLQRVTEDPLGFVGQIIYNTSERTFKFYNGLEWKGITGDYPTLAEFNQEVQDRIAGDANLQSQVDTLDGTTAQLIADLALETQNRIAEDASLQTQIDNTKDDLDTEIQDRIDGDANLQTQVDANAQAIATETTNRIANDNIIYGEISNEESARIAADNTLQGNIDAEATTRANADSNLQNNIDAEESARIAADGVLQGQIDSNDTDITNLQNDKQDISLKGQPNGYASLDSGAKIPEAELPDSILGQVVYEGTWDASTNTPTLANPPALETKGHYYVVDTEGTQFGITFHVGDWIISKGTEWQKVDNTDAVTSVFGRLGNILANESDYSAFYPLISDIGDGTLTVSGTGVLGGSGTFTANQSGNSSIDITHNGVGRVDVVTSVSPSFGTSFQTISSVTSSAEGHITGTTEQTVTLPTPNDSTITLSAGTGISGGGFFTTDQSTDDTIVFSHADTSSQASVDNTGGTVIQDVTLDDFGHITGLSSVDLDSRYIQSETDTLQSVTDRGATTTNAITVGGATINGNLAVDTDTLFVDSTNNRVGIGTSSPSERLEVNGNIELSTSENAIQWQSGNGIIQAPSNLYVRTTGAGGNLLFQVNNSEAMRIDSSGNVGMNAIPENSAGTWRNYQLGSLSMAGRSNDTNPDAMFGTNFKFTTANAEQRISAHPTSRLFFNDDVITFQNAGADSAGSNITWSERMRIDSSGNVAIGGSPNFNEIFTVNSTTKASTPVPRMSNDEVSAFTTAYIPQSGQMIYNYEQDRLLIGTYTGGFATTPKWNDNKNYFRSIATPSINTYSSYTLSWFSVTYWNITLQANTTFGQSSYPSSGSGQQMQIIMTGNYTPTFPSNWQLSPYSDSYDGTQRNLITAIYHGYDFNTGTHLIYYTIENMDTASGGGSSVNEKFEFTIDTTQGIASTYFAMELTIVGGPSAPPAVIDWGDGTTTTSYGGYVDHNYASQVSYNISIEGNIAAKISSVGASPFGSMITNISNWGNNHIIDSAFTDNLQMTITATDAPSFDASLSSGSVSYAFQNCVNINPDVSEWDVSGIQYFDFMFNGCSSMNQSFDTWDVSSAYNFFEFIAGTATSVGNYSKTLISWAQQDVRSQLTDPQVYLSTGPQYAVVADYARQTLVHQYGWSISDGGLLPYYF